MIAQNPESYHENGLIVRRHLKFIHRSWRLTDANNTVLAEATESGSAVEELCAGMLAKSQMSCCLWPTELIIQLRCLVNSVNVVDQIRPAVWEALSQVPHNDVWCAKILIVLLIYRSVYRWQCDSSWRIQTTGPTGLSQYHTSVAIECEVKVWQQLTDW